jgi:hypothetical protein
MIGVFKWMAWLAAVIGAYIVLFTPQVGLAYAGPLTMTGVALIGAAICKQAHDQELARQAAESPRSDRTR